MHTSAALIEEIIATQQSEGPAFGAIVKMEKQKILLERCSSAEEAHALKERLCTRFPTIPRDRIHHIHT